MRLPVIIAIALASFSCSPATSSAQIFKRLTGQCYTDANGNTVCPQRAPLRLQQSHPANVYQSQTYVYESYPTVSYGSSGSSMGSAGSTPTVAPSLPSAGTASVLRKSDFRASLMKAAKAAREKGEITAAQYFKIAAMSRIPKVAANLEAAMQEAAIEEGLASATGQIDWDAIIEFIEKLIPLIIQLIDLFSANLPSKFDPTLEQSYAFSPPDSFLRAAA